MFDEQIIKRLWGQDYEITTQNTYDNKLNILGSDFIHNKKAIYNLDHSDLGLRNSLLDYPNFAFIVIASIV